MKTDPDVPPTTAMEMARQTRNPLHKIYYWTLHWAGTRFAVPALFVISFAEASFFPVPPDALLLPMCFARPKRWYLYAAVCTVASVIGAVAGWTIGFYLWHFVSEYFFRWIPGFTPALFEKVSALYQQNAFWVILIKGLTPIPFKLVTISAGACKVSLFPLIVASIISRGARFFFVAGLVRAFGEKARPFIEKYLTWVLLACFALLIGGLLVLKFLPH